MEGAEMGSETVSGIPDDFVENNMGSMGSHGVERFCAVDPGVTTGFLTVDLPSNWRQMDLYNLLSSYFRAANWALEGGPAFPSCVQEEVKGHENRQIDHISAVILGRKNRRIMAKSVIIEDFILRQRTQGRDLLAPVRLGSALNDRLWNAGFQGEIVWQSPSDAKSVVTDARLKQWDLWYSGSPHIRDAWRHMVKYLRDNRG